jgi:putative endonuclease
MFIVYVLEFLEDRGWYIGFTSQPLKDRLNQHRSAEVITTKDRGAFRLMYFEGYRHKMDALGRERFLKSGSGRRFLKKQLFRYLQHLG